MNVEGEEDASRSRTNESTAHPETQTLGVLLVHGVGSQRRGDVLVHCVTALHKWLRDWLTTGHFGKELAIDLVDVNVAESGPERPAQARIIFRRGNEVSRYSWLLAESCWFETYRRPGFFEFARWALRVVPVAVVIHFLPRYRRAWGAFHASHDALERGKLRTPEFLAITRALGLAASDKKLTDLAQQEFLETCRTSMMLRCLGIQLKLVLAAALGLVIQLLLLAVVILAVIPGITRSFAGWVQLQLSATLGDSYLFVTSPITKAAVATRVKKDLEWLSGQCDRVIVVAHSQGAAVSYSVIERGFWGGHVPEKLHAVITYGSGLRKLFDLEQTARNLRLWTLLGVYAMVISSLMAGLIVLFLNGVVPWWGALLGTALGVLLQMLPLRGPENFVVDPGVLKVAWYDRYSSHDPVPSGPIDFKRRELSSAATIESAILTYMDAVFVRAFQSRQREVVNRRSIVGDHTSYWSSQDDFVAGVAGILAEASGIPIHLTLDEEWLKVSTERRRWRVTWLSRCRAVEGLMAASILLWPREVLEPIGSQVRAPAVAALGTLPVQLAAWVPLVPDWLLGAVGLILVTYLMFLVASRAWHVWEGRELERFFRRIPHSSVGLAGWVFALGWVGVLASALLCALAYARFSREALLMMAWMPSALAVWSAWIVNKSRSAPGTPRDWGRRALWQAEQLLADTNLDRIDALRSARVCFQESQEHLEQSDTEGWVRAVLGETRVIEELAESDANVRDQTAAAYRAAIEALEHSGHDASEVEARLRSFKDAQPSDAARA